MNKSWKIINLKTNIENKEAKNKEEIWGKSQTMWSQTRGGKTTQAHKGPKETTWCLGLSKTIGVLLKCKINQRARALLDNFLQLTLRTVESLTFQHLSRTN